MLDTTHGLDDVYTQSVQDQHFERWHPTTACEFLQLLKQGSLSTLVIKRGFTLRALILHPPPGQSIPLECHDCSTVVRDLPVHVRDECLPFFRIQRSLRARALCLLLTVMQGTVESRSSLGLLEGRYRLRFTLEGPHFPVVLARQVPPPVRPHYSLRFLV